jgi:hypothetical protein
VPSGSADVSLTAPIFALWKPDVWVVSSDLELCHVRFARVMKICELMERFMRHTAKVNTPTRGSESILKVALPVWIGVNLPLNRQCGLSNGQNRLA